LLFNCVGSICNFVPFPQVPTPTEWCELDQKVPPTQSCIQERDPKL
jgi:hypothetical protein